MIRVARMVSVKPGKHREAIAFGKEIAKALTQKSSAECKVFVQIGGSGMMCWQADLENISEFEKVINILSADDEYAKATKDSGELFIDVASTDIIWKEI